MRALALLFLVSFFAAAHGAPDASYSKSTEFGALRVSYVGLQSVLDKARSLASSANGGASLDREELLLQAGDVRVSASGNRLVDSPAKIPDQIDQLDYSIIGGKSDPISQVSLELAGYRRTLTVRGASPDQVDAVFATLSADLSSMSHPIGGSSIQLLLGFPLRWLLLIFAVACAWNWYVTRKTSYGVWGASLSLALLLVFFMPFDQLLAGFLAVRGDPSPLVRYGAEISFLGFVLALLGIPSLVLPFLKRDSALGSTPIDPEPPKSPVKRRRSRKKPPPSMTDDV